MTEVLRLHRFEGPAAERDGILATCRDNRAVLATVPGCIAQEIWCDTVEDAPRDDARFVVVTFSRWADATAMAAGGRRLADHNAARNRDVAAYLAARGVRLDPVVLHAV